MWYLILVCAVIVIIFSFVIFFGAPFLPTRRSRIIEAVNLVGLKPGQVLLELGSGDGRILREAAKRGIRGIGYELNPLLVAYSRFLCWRYRKLVTIHLNNYWQQPLPHCDAIYVFLLNPYMAKLDAKISAEATQPLKLVSFAFPIPHKKATQESNGLLLYTYKKAT